MNCGAVVIGRNEGPRLDACLRSLSGQGNSIVYVDSCSSDNSLEIAGAARVEIVELDTSQPFTAARARNAGFARLTELEERPSIVQFVDGDCVIDPDWLARAQSFLREQADVAVVCGRLRERFPQRSIYNRLCDVEWDTPLGEADACGGIAMVRADAFAAVGGFNPDIIAGEEPELCVRLRQRGWKIWRLDAEMASHDAAIATFSQWWKRTKRGGYAYALGASIHGAAPERHWVRERRRALFWGVLLPLAALAGAFLSPMTLFPLLLYPLQVARIAANRKDLGWFSLIYSLFMVLAKFSETTGILQFYFDNLLGRRSAIIEYKDAAGIVDE